MIAITIGVTIAVVIGLLCSYVLGRMDGYIEGYEDRKRDHVFKENMTAVLKELDKEN